MKKYLENFIPSLFVVTSPFQAMCAIEAIRVFKITDYKFVVCVIGDSRDFQLYTFLKKMNIDYSIENFQNIRYSSVFLKPLFQKNRTYYKRAFLGDVDNFRQRHVAYKLLSKKSIISFLDDGTKDIPYLMGKRKLSVSKYSILEFLIRRILNIHLTHSHFTMFSDIALPKFECRMNNLTCFSKNIASKPVKDIFFVGTNSYMYCKKMNIAIDIYNRELESIFEYLKNKYGDNNVYYIPHGMDKNDSIKLICEKNGVCYQQVDKTVELFILELPYRPIAIYSNTSTALFTMKLICPQIKVYNIFSLGDPQSRYYNDYKLYSEYFEQRGIPLLRIK